MCQGEESMPQPGYATGQVNAKVAWDRDREAKSAMPVWPATVTDFKRRREQLVIVSNRVAQKIQLLNELIRLFEED